MMSMTPNDDKPNFLDRGTLTAFALIILFWFGWSRFMESKYPTPTPPPVSAQAPVEKPAAAVTGGTAAVKQEPVAYEPVTALGVEKRLNYTSETMAFEVSSHGMGLRNIDVRNYKTRTNEPIVLGGVAEDLPFSSVLHESNKAIEFVMEQPSPDVFVGRARVGGLEIEKQMTVRPASFSIETQIKVSGDMSAFKGIVTLLNDTLHPYESGGMLSGGSYDHQDWFVRHDGTKTRTIIDNTSITQMSVPNASVAALSAHYFTLAVVDRSDLLPRFESNVPVGAKTAVGRLAYIPVSKPESFTVKYVAFAGPKNFELLGNVDESLSLIVDYGMFGFLGKPILWLLKYIYSLIGNWGWAIVILTIIVRAIVLPFNAYAYKSMKALQKIQPQMNSIKEKYKDKPADQKLQMNQEIMTLMKDNSASPLGGCLPTLLQLPVFFALFQVLGQSIELYRAPYIFWIHDLSVKDPFYVLPVLMGITMFVQQKITPTTMDPQQAKILQWMPVIFSVFMLSLPSGLTLYIFVSTLFGIIQQYMFMREKATVQGSSVKEAKA